MEVRARVAVASHVPGADVLEISVPDAASLGPAIVDALSADVSAGLGYPIRVVIRPAEGPVEEFRWSSCAGSEAAVPGTRADLMPGANTGTPEGPADQAGAVDLQHEYLSWRRRRGLQPSDRFERLANEFRCAASAEGFPTLR